MPATPQLTVDLLAFGNPHFLDIPLVGDKLGIIDAHLAVLGISAGVSCILYIVSKLGIIDAHLAVLGISAGVSCILYIVHWNSYAVAECNARLQ